eukprot:3931818-Pyramimonas_sp.AAC.1
MGAAGAGGAGNAAAAGRGASRESLKPSGAEEGRYGTRTWPHGSHSGPSLEPLESTPEGRPSPPPIPPSFLARAGAEQ